MVSTIIKEKNQTLVDNVVFLETETFSYSPSFITKAEQHTPKYLKKTNPSSPEPSSCSTRMTANTSPKKKRYHTEQFKQSFLTSLRDDEDDCYDINDISFLELGGNDDE